jgi:hypothetical protein
MSVARGYGLNGKSVYMNVAKPMNTFIQFTVNAADTGGLGITSLKSNGFVESVFMHTSQTPGAVNGYTNPNPASGYAFLRFKNNFNYWLSGYSVQYPPLTSTGTTSVTANSVYVITALGTATLAQWQAVGLPAGLTPAVGQAFIAIASQSIGGSATVGIPGVPVAPIVTVVGNPTASIANSNIAQNAGAQLMLQFSSVSSTFTGSALAAHSHALLLKNAAVSDGATTRVNAGTNLLGANTGSDITVAGGGANGGVQTTSAGTPAGTIANAYAATNPADGTVVYLQVCYDGSTVTIDGI